MGVRDLWTVMSAQHLTDGLQTAVNVCIFCQNCGTSTHWNSGGLTRAGHKCGEGTHRMFAGGTRYDSCTHLAVAGTRACCSNWGAGTHVAVAGKQ